MGSKNLRLAELATNVDASGAYTQVQGVTVYDNTAAFPVSGNAAGDLAFDDSDNGLYIHTGEGWYNIGLVNQTPTITSGGAGSYLLATDGTPTVITLIGSDPDGFPVTWSYSTSGLDSEATIVQGTGDSSNIFTITPNTNEAKAGTFTVTFSLTDGLNIATDVNSFTLVFGDANIDDVVALMQTERTTWIADAGSSKLDLNVRNNTYPTSFSPYRGSYYSVEFDGSGDYITATATSTAGTGDFTWEGWIYLESSSLQRIFDLGNGLLYTDGSGKLTYYTTGANIVDANVVTLYKWQHVAVVRISGTTKLYVDGTQVGSDYSDSRNYTSTSIGFGADLGSVTQFLNGYMSNIRITIGTGLYTGSFTPSTSPLTTTSQGATASEVEILTCQSNRFIDNSTNSHTITVNGDTAISGRTPFATPTAMESYGSGYFSGSDDRIDTSNITPDPFSVGTGDYCFEMWMYVEQLIGTYIPVYIGGIGRLSFLITTNGTNFQIANYGYSGVVNITGNFVFNAWNHVAFTRDNGYARIFHNGVQIGSDTAESNNWSSSGFVIGANHVGTSDELQGYIADARVVVGSPVYTSNFSVPTTPLTAITNTKLLFLQNSYPHDNKSVVERSGANTSLENYGEVNTSAFSPYSPFGYSNYFDGTGDYLVVPANNDFLFDAGDFTIEAWIHPNVTGTQIGIVNNWQIGGAFQFYILNTNKLYFTFTNASSGVSDVNFTSADSISPDVWTHVALVRSGSSLYFFINGTLDSGGTHSVTATMYYYNGAAKDLKIGTAGDTGSLWNGYISNLRIIKGVGLYTSNFTPSTSALTPTDETVLLTCQSPSFIDNGPKKHSLTRYGDARVTPYSPLKGHTVTPDTYSLFTYTGNSTDYARVSYSNNELDVNGDFTIEFWFYELTELASIASICWGQGTGFAVGLNAYDGGGNRKLDFRRAGAAPVYGTTDLQQNTWYHACITRDGTALRLFIDGDLEYYNSNWTTTFSSTYMDFGDKTSENGYIYHGLISNFRVVKGSVVYSTSETTVGNNCFTVPTAPLTAVTNTVFLGFQDSTLKDNSGNNLTITTTGVAQPTEFNPFGYTTTTNQQYSPTTHGGSMYGDGTTDYVDVPANAWNSLGTGDFCIQFWTYSKEVDANKGQIAIGGNKISIRFDSSNRMTFWVAGNGGPTSTPNNTVYPFNWYHVCLERSGSTNTLYINGVAQASNTTTPSNDAEPIIRIGGQYANNTGYTFTGWISDLSIRSKAVYKGNFVPPKQVVYGDQTKLQVPFDAAVYDSKGQLTYEINSLRVSNKAGKFNNQALKFAGVNDYVYTEERHGTAKVYGEQLMLGTGDYTIEFWWNFASTSGRQDLLWIGSTSTRLGILWNLNAGQLTYYPGTDAISATVSFSADTWYHIALARSSGYTKMFVDGTQVGSTYTDSKDLNGTILYLGKDSGANSSYANGYMDGLRITRGVARYTSNFTAPTDVFSKR